MDLHDAQGFCWQIHTGKQEATPCGPENHLFGLFPNAPQGDLLPVLRWFRKNLSEL
jgi:hypothetical protein